ncbi:MAG: prolipoprotein diacylglyceryl transferase [Syntrophaceae bacterium]
MDSFIQFWQHLPEHINPSIFQIGSFQLRWYSMMYIAAFLTTYLLAVYRIRREERFRDYSSETVQDLFIWMITGLIIGARLGYVVFYNFSYYAHHPLEIILPFEFSDGLRFVGISGMSYHGGAIGVLIAGLIYCRKYKIDFWNLADLLCPIVPLGYTFGRLGNFLNGELYGRVTNAAWGMYFPYDPTRQLRHPSQLYEAFFEGIFLFAILWRFRKAGIPKGAFLGVYIIGYGAVRFIIEAFREPDSQLGFVLGPFTMGQLLCLAMIIIAALVSGDRKSYQAKAAQAAAKG